jgi:excisionase family DNA binding protein
MTRSELLELIRKRIEDAEAMGATAPVAQTLRLVLRELEELEPEVLRKVPNEDRLLSARQVAERLGVSTYFIYRAVANGQLPFARRLGPRKLRFSERELERWLARQAG